MIENFQKSTEYVIENIKINEEEFFKEIHKKALELEIPIVTKDVLKFILFLLELSKSKKVLEIGSAIGYSSSYIADNLSNRNGELVTIEIDEKRYNIAKEILNSKFSNVLIYNMDALNYLDEAIEKNLKFDFIFIDAQKGKYNEFLEKSVKILDENGIIFIDNILFRSFVGIDSEDVPKKYRNMTIKMDEFIKYIVSKYNATILPFGDGVGLIKYEDINTK